MCRVSSDEQARTGYSLGDQEERLKDYCKRNDYEIAYVIREDHSAKSFDRPEWKKWMELVKGGKFRVDELLIITWDRFSRDITDGFNVIRDLQKRKITPQAIDQPIDFNIPEQLMMLAVYMAAPDVENKKRSMFVRRGIRQGLKQGRWPRPAVFGYTEATDAGGKHIIVPDPQKAQLVTYIFEQAASGVSQVEIRKELRKKGVVVSRNNLCNILKRILYAGKIAVPACDNEPAVIVEGIHEPLVSETLFYEVQQMLSGNRKARGKSIPKYSKVRNDFPLRGVICCRHCNNAMTASLSRGKLGKRYGYYHCNHCKDQRESADKVHKAFEELLDSIAIVPEIKELYTVMLEEQLVLSKEGGKVEAKSLQKQLDQINERLVRSQDLMLDGKLDPHEYVQIKSRYSAHRDEIVQKIKGLKVSSVEYAGLLQSGLNLLAKLSEAYENCTVGLKQKIVGSIFPELFSFDGKKCRTPKLNPVFELFASIGKGLGKNKRGQMNVKFQLSPSAERGGFEPPVHFWRTAV